MHFIALVTVEIPNVIEDYQKNQEIEEYIKNLKKLQKRDARHVLQEVYIEKLAGLTTEFARTVDYEVGEIMAPYNECTENIAYLEFEDLTDKLQKEYFYGKPDCIRLPNGTILEADNYPKFIILDGLVYQQNAGPICCMKRTKKAKKMTALPAYSRRKLFKSFEDYVEYYGVSFDVQKKRYGYWFNPNAFWDWYSIGGRWPDMFLVKDTCSEFSIGERNWCKAEKEYEAPEGFMWVCAARKKDIEWEKIREWGTLKAKECYEKLQYIYDKAETLDSYMQRTMPAEWKYPINFNDIVDEDTWQSKDDIQIGKEQKSWHTHIDEYIDSLSDDTVLVGVDYHN